MELVTPLAADRLRRSKAAFTTRYADLEAFATLLDGDLAPASGDLVLARVDEIGQHTRIELPDGRRATLFVGDEVVVAYGNRYAPDQFEAEVPDDLGPCDLVAAGGLAAQVLSQHLSIEKPATRLVPAGLLADAEGMRCNLARWALKPGSLTGTPRASAEHRPQPLVVAVVGTAMNSGKSTAAAHLIYGLVSAGRSVGALKLTGTGSGPDLWFMTDAGAAPVLDFTAAGHPSTYRLGLDQLLAVLHTLTALIAEAEVDVVVVEVADGLCQPETAMLLASPDFAQSVDAVVFTAHDALGAEAGVRWLRNQHLPVVAVSGRLTASPLARREAAHLIRLPVLGPEELADPAQALALVLLEPISCSASA